MKKNFFRLTNYKLVFIVVVILFISLFLIKKNMEGFQQFTPGANNGEPLFSNCNSFSPACDQGYMYDETNKKCYKFDDYLLDSYKPRTTKTCRSGYNRYKIDGVLEKNGMVYNWRCIKVNKDAKNTKNPNCPARRLDNRPLNFSRDFGLPKGVHFLQGNCINLKPACRSGRRPTKDNNNIDQCLYPSDEITCVSY